MPSTRAGSTCSRRSRANRRIRTRDPIRCSSRFVMLPRGGEEAGNIMVDRLSGASSGQSKPGGKEVAEVRGKSSGQPRVGSRMGEMPKPSSRCSRPRRFISNARARRCGQSARVTLKVTGPQGSAISSVQVPGFAGGMDGSPVVRARALADGHGTLPRVDAKTAGVSFPDIPLSELVLATMDSSLATLVS